MKLCTENKYYYVSFLALFIFIILRQWERIHYLTLYAEDGGLFLPRTVTYGYKAILMSYAGYLQVAPQLVSLLSYHITLIYYPIATLFICSFIYTYAISLIIGSSYSWINSNQAVRFFIALSLTFIPGTPEILGNLANLHTVLFILVTFRLMARFDEKYTLLDYVIFILTAFSAGEFFLILPILLYRIFIIYKFKLKSIHIVQHLIILCIMVMLIIINYKLATSDRIIVSKNLVDVTFYLARYLPNFLLTVSNRLFYLPFLGNLTILLNHYYATSIAIGVGLLFLTIIISITKKMYIDSYFILLIMALVAQMLEILLTVTVREAAAKTAFLGQLTEITSLRVRYCIFMMPIIIIFWQVFVNKLLEKLNWRKLTISVILVVTSLYTIRMNHDRLILRNFYGIPHEKLDEKYLWPYNAQLIYNMLHDGNPETLTLPSAPMGWHLTISQPQK
ncbi:MAG: hypothetical protein K0R14_1357 [Burkholderiales bacterium]|jgi:hypothetical protein|nr:hypothetical protein [Burkholderiales bacterium]